MRISDWSSDVCSSDLPARGLSARWRGGERGSCHGGASWVAHVVGRPFRADYARGTYDIAGREMESLRPPKCQGPGTLGKRRDVLLAYRSAWRPLGAFRSFGLTR